MHRSSCLTISAIVVCLLTIVPSSALAVNGPECYQAGDFWWEFAVEPAYGPPGSTVIVSGTWCGPSQGDHGTSPILEFQWDGKNAYWDKGQYFWFPVDPMDGSFRFEYTIPADAEAGGHSIWIVGCCPAINILPFNVGANEAPDPGEKDQDGLDEDLSVQEDTYVQQDGYVVAASDSPSSKTGINRLPHTGAGMSWHHAMAGVASVSLAVTYRAARSRQS